MLNALSSCSNLIYDEYGMGLLTIVRPEAFAEVQLRLTGFDSDLLYTQSKSNPVNKIPP